MEPKDNLSEIDKLEIEPLSDDALEMVAGGKTDTSSGGTQCCSCQQCSNVGPQPRPVPLQP